MIFASPFVVSPSPSTSMVAFLNTTLLSEYRRRRREQSQLIRMRRVREERLIVAGTA